MLCERKLDVWGEPRGSYKSARFEIIHLFTKQSDCTLVSEAVLGTGVYVGESGHHGHLCTGSSGLKAEQRDTRLALHRRAKGFGWF